MTQELARLFIRYVVTQTNSVLKVPAHFVLIELLGLSQFAYHAFARVLSRPTLDLFFHTFELTNKINDETASLIMYQLDASVFRPGITFHPITCLHECPHVTESAKNLPIDRIFDSHHDTAFRLINVLLHLVNTDLQIPLILREAYTNQLNTRQQERSIRPEWLSMQNNLEKLLSRQGNTLWKEFDLFPKLLQACTLILDAPLAEMSDLMLFHTYEYLGNYCKTSKELSLLHTASSTQIINSSAAPNRLMGCGAHGIDSETYWNPDWSVLAARSAVGQLIYLARLVCERRLPNGMALIRPPGHHAEQNHAMGFCYLNSIAVTALTMLARGLARRIFIFDWDVHHGNGTAQVLKNCQPGQILYSSVHRYDKGSFYPGTGHLVENNRYHINIAWDSEPAQTESNASPCQVDAAERRNLWRHSKTSRVAGAGPGNEEVTTEQLSQKPLYQKENLFEAAHARRKPGEAEYIAAMRSIVMPVAREFQPDLVLVSAGFDASYGHSDNIGGYDLPPGLFAWMTRQLMTLAEGSVVLALEGGYDKDSLCECTAKCVEALLVPPPLNKSTSAIALDDLQSAYSYINMHELIRPPTPWAISTLEKTRDRYSPSMTSGSTGWESLRHIESAFIAK
ncbi:hypothetical protein Ciccas_009035 [Cichlidogyrus casuarinus]|uniref:histone deacetylase n=1 Tax=Cichlidogyrus casuarinus TaxID=1844966 RepID=A0ABD2PZV7_9PLAT